MKIRTLITSLIQPLVIALAAGLVPVGAARSAVLWTALGFTAAAMALDCFGARNRKHPERSGLLLASAALNWAAWGLLLSAVFGQFDPDGALQQSVDMNCLMLCAGWAALAALALSIWRKVKWKRLRTAGAWLIALVALAAGIVSPFSLTLVLPVLLTALSHYYHWDTKSECARIAQLSFMLPAIGLLIFMLAGLLLEWISDERENALRGKR